MRINVRNFVDYFVLVIFIGLSGIPSFHSKAITILEFSMLFLVFILRKRKFDKTFLIFFVFLVTITVLRALKFQFFSLVTSLGFFLMVSSAYLVVKLLEDKFMNYYINVIYFFAIVSLLFFIPFTIVPSLATFFTQTITPLFSSLHPGHDSFLLYNIAFTESGHVRNSGPFWEPGAFTGYLIVAYTFNFFTSAKKMTKKNIVFLVTIFTTLSTTAYLTLFAFFVFIYYKKIKNIFLKVMGISVLVAVGIYAYTTFDFLGEKIEEQINVAQTAGVEQSDNTQRFLSMLRDFQDLEGHELIGRGGNDLTRYDVSPGEKIILRTVGLTDVLVRLGSIAFVIIFYLLWKSICSYLEWNHEKKLLYCAGIFVAIFLTLVSECFFNRPMYWSLLFLLFTYRKKEKARFA